jgi:tRNA-Thr(GGU) m(6)t(6)A37 methyltransferase TsaA
MDYTVRPIGVIHTPFVEATNTPIQPIAAEGVRGWIDLDDEFVPGLADLEGFSHIILVYRFHKIEAHALKVIPFMDTVERGIFATKAPKRPNQIGLSTVKLVKVTGNRLDIEQVDMLDGTPLLDIKPFYPRYDNRTNVRIGWLEANKDAPVETLRADGRFSR